MRIIQKYSTWFCFIARDSVTWNFVLIEYSQSAPYSGYMIFMQLIFVVGLKLLRVTRWNFIIDLTIFRLYQGINVQQTQRFVSSTSKVKLIFVYRHTISDIERLQCTLQRQYKFQQSSSFNNQKIRIQRSQMVNSEGLIHVTHSQRDCVYYQCVVIDCQVQNLANQ